MQLPLLASLNTAGALQLQWQSTSMHLTVFTLPAASEYELLPHRCPNAPPHAAVANVPNTSCFHIAAPCAESCLRFWILIYPYRELLRPRTAYADFIFIGAPLDPPVAHLLLGGVEADRACGQALPVRSLFRALCDRFVLGLVFPLRLIALATGRSHEVCEPTRRPVTWPCPWACVNYLKSPPSSQHPRPNALGVEAP